MQVVSARLLHAAFAAASATNLHDRQGKGSPCRLSTVGVAAARGSYRNRLIPAASRGGRADHGFRFSCLSRVLVGLQLPRSRYLEPAKLNQFAIGPARERPAVAGLSPTDNESNIRKTTNHVSPRLRIT